MELRRAVFLDRDGIINKKAREHDYIKSWDEFEFLPDIEKVISALNKHFLVVVISNQAGIAKKIMTAFDVELIGENMRSELKKKNAVIDAVYVCPHATKEHCACRKPKPGLILQAAEDLNIDVAQSYMVGDSNIDIEAGKQAGCKTIFFGNTLDMQSVQPDYVINNILEILDIVE